MRILVISNLFPTGDHQNRGSFILRRIRAHHDLGNTVHVVALNPGAARPLRDLLPVFDRRLPTHRDSPAEHIELPVRIPLSARIRKERSRHPPRGAVSKAVGLLRRVLDPSAFDVIHAHGMYMFPAGSVASHLSTSTGVPFAITTHGSDVNIVMPHRRRSYSAVLDSAGAVAHVSDALRDRARELGAESGNATVIPNGVDCQLFSPPDTHEADRNGTHFPRIAFVGNLVEVKGADRLPAIFRGISSQIPNASFVLAGEGYLRASLEKESGDLDVAFLGSISPTLVADVLRDADLLVLPSRQEGWPCVVLEAHACGTPVVGSDAGGTPEAIADRRYVVADGEDFIQRFVRVSVATLRETARIDDLRSHALNFSWHSIASLETAMLQRAAHRRSATK